MPEPCNAGYPDPTNRGADGGADTIYNQIRSTEGLVIVNEHGERHIACTQNLNRRLAGRSAFGSLA